MFLATSSAPSMFEDKATNVATWIKGQVPLKGEKGTDFAKRICDEKYGSGNYKKGAGSEFSQAQKYADRGYK